MSGSMYRSLLCLAVPLVLAPTVASADAQTSRGPSLSTLAAATDRPAECGALQSKGGKGGKRANVWRLSRNPNLGAYCDAIAKSHALMESDPEGALAAARSAESTLPGHASTFAAIGRAELALGHVTESVTAFESAKKLDGRALDEPKAMNDFAWALVRAGRASDAAPIFRALVPRANLLPDRARSVVFLRATYALMAHAAANPASASADFADAAAYLSEARTDTTSALYGDALVTAVLVYDRAGDVAKASAALEEAKRVRASSIQDTGTYVAIESDALALAAIGAEVGDPANAGAAWQKYLDASPPEAFAKTARDRKANLGKPAKR
jgi:tetratricopeptide (TPR) repeat protein